MGRFGFGLLILWGLLPVAPVFAEAPPVEFALNDLRAALKERKRTGFRIRTEITTAAPETYRISAYRVQGGDLRGLMYGILAAADQIRRRGRLLPESGKPAVAIRGIRRYLHNEELEADWYHSREYWRDYIRMLARNRLNRLNLVFAHQTNYLAPPYPYWVEVAEFPEIRAPGLTDAERERNLETLCFIAQTAADHAVDFTLGVWQHDAQARRQTPMVEGLTPENIGPYSYQALKKVLAACPSIRSVQVRTNRESGIPPAQQVEFYRDYVYRALREAGRLVTLDLRGWIMSEGMLNAATGSGLPMRLSSKYWAEHMGRPYQPAETFPNYSYINFLRRRPPDPDGKPRPYDFFWEIWALGSHRMLLWGDPDYVSRAASTLTLSESLGFEIDEPLAQKGFGNRPGKWGIFAEGQEERKFWKWEFERYWMFYVLWGRLAYDPKVPARVWMNELKRRYGDAAADVLEAYQKSSAVLHEIMAVNTPDPNMYVWPEINPGGLIDYYIAAPPSSRRYVASITEFVRDRIAGRPSARQTPLETAARLSAMAEGIESALAKVARTVDPDNREWKGTEPDFRVLALLARFHSHRQRAAERLVWYYETADREALAAARNETEAGIAVWEKLVAFTDGLYPANMAFGLGDYGHWKDKLVYLRHDLETLREREWLLDRFGRFEHGFDFGGELRKLGYRQLIRTSVEPRFLPVAPDTTYAEDTGYGWVTDGNRTANALDDAVRGTVQAGIRKPPSLPENALFGDSIHGAGAQTFRVRTGPGEFLVRLLTPDGNATTRPANANSGVVDVIFPRGDWEVSAVIVKSVKPELASRAAPPPDPPKRPAFSHVAPPRATPGRDLTLTLRVTPPSAAETVRLHYRPLNALEKFRTLEAPPATATFTVPADEFSGEWDLLYYFEVLHSSGGWFHPNPHEKTPYFVVPVKEAARRRR